MGALLSNGSVFLHIPKTGGNWVIKVLADLGLVEKEFKEKHADAKRARVIEPKIGIGNRFTFCFTRDPISWYESWWRYQVQRGWTKWSYLTWHPCARMDACSDNNFNKFIANVIRIAPGFVSDMYSRFTVGADYVGHQETLAACLINVLDKLRVEYDDRIKRIAPINESVIRPIKWDGDLRKQIEILEK